jgi:nicotinamidase-related amidase
MPEKNEDLHGNVPDKSSVALLLIDVINDLEFEGGEKLLRHALPMSKNLAELKRRAKEAGVPVIYVNDNFGKWQSDFKKILEHCLNDDVRGRPVVEALKPEVEDDYFVLKPKHSGFFSTTLDILLDYLGVRTLILTGLTGDICVLFTAHDAYMRDFNLVVPSDCIASQDPRDNEYTLRKMAGLMDADTRPAAEIDFEELQRGRATREPEPKPEPEPKQTARGQTARR